MSSKRVFGSKSRLPAGNEEAADGGWSGGDTSPLKACCGVTRRSRMAITEDETKELARFLQKLALAKATLFYVLCVFVSRLTR